jgi:hypothetical protein
MRRIQGMRAVVVIAILVGATACKNVFLPYPDSGSSSSGDDSTGDDAASGDDSLGDDASNGDDSLGDDAASSDGSTADASLIDATISASDAGSIKDSGAQ